MIGTARVVCRAAGVRWSQDMPLQPLEPFACAVFRLADLPRSSQLEYWVAAASTAEQLPDPDVLAAGPARSLRLLPHQRPARMAVVCDRDGGSAARHGDSSRLWGRLAELVRTAQVDALLLVGTPTPTCHDTNDPSAAGLREHSRRELLASWSRPEVAAVLGSCPTLLAWNELDQTRSPARAQPANGGPTQVARQLQATLQAHLGAAPLRDGGGEDLTWWFQHGGRAVIALDCGAQSSASPGAMLDEQQLSALEATLTQLAGQRLDSLFVVLNPPFLFAPSLAAHRLAPILPAGEREPHALSWTAPPNRAQCRRVLEALLGFSQRSGAGVVVVAADYQVGTLGRIDASTSHESAAPPPFLYQVTSSGIENQPPSAIESLVLQVVARGAAATLVQASVGGCLLPVSEAPMSHILPHRHFVVLEHRSADDAQGAALLASFFAEVGQDVIRIDHALPAYVASPAGASKL